MKLRYYHVKIVYPSRNMPILLWRWLIGNLKVVYAAFGMKRDTPYSHSCYIFYEDDGYLRGYGHNLEYHRDKLEIWREEHDISAENLLAIRSWYSERCPTIYQVDNIDDYIADS